MKRNSIFFVILLFNCVSAVSEIKVLPENISFDLKSINNHYLVIHNTDKHKEPPPLLIFLHGAGERGTDISKLETGAGIPPTRFFDKEKNQPFLILAPQCLPNTWWDVDELNLWFDHISKTEKFDKKRIYLTGLSMGGFGTFKWVANNEPRFAAAASICGGWERKNFKSKPSGHELENLISVPLWVFHGDKDKVVPSWQSKNMVNLVKANGSNKIKFTLFESLGHAIWEEVYVSNNQLYEWFLQHKSK